MFPPQICVYLCVTGTTVLASVFLVDVKYSLRGNIFFLDSVE